MLRVALLTAGGLVAIALVAFYAVIGMPAPMNVLAMLQGSERVAPGFIGIANFGQWRLICMSGPQSLEGLAAEIAATPSQTSALPTRGNACRVNQEMPAPLQPGTDGSKPEEVILAANFSLVGERRTPSAMIRLPATAQAGDIIGLRFDDGVEVKTTVRDCGSTECMAAGTLNDAEWQRLSAAKSFQITFPAAGRQWVLLDLPVEGLSNAIAAMDRAEQSAD